MTGKLRLGARSDPDIAANHQCSESLLPAGTAVKGGFLWPAQVMLQLHEKVLLSAARYLDFLGHCLHTAGIGAEKKAPFFGEYFPYMTINQDASKNFDWQHFLLSLWYTK